MKITIDNGVPFIKGLLEPYAEVQYIHQDDFTRQRICDSDALIIRTRTRCNSALLDNTKVKFIATATIGFDHIDTEYCNSHGITTARAAGCNARGVLQWVAAVLRHIVIGANRQPQDYTLGVVGVGNVGSLVADYAERWGFRVLKCDPPRQQREGGDFLPIEELARQCDIITFHTPLDSTTRHLINQQLIDLMPREAIIINASRGGVADTQAIMRSKHRYMFDVWEDEPNIDTEILANAEIASQHIAGYSKQGKANATAMCVAQLADHFNLPIKGWYPSEVRPSMPRDISWEDMCRTIEQYCSTSELTNTLKNSPADFEILRNEYIYREEYF